MTDYLFFKGKRYRLVLENPSEIHPFKMVTIPSGEFLMGSSDGCDDETPVHHVVISKPFRMMTTPVTQAQWLEVMGANPSHFKNHGLDCPVENVSWNDVQEFIRRCNEKYPGNGYRLPTEAEWEYACRAGSTTKYFFGDDPKKLEEYAWFVENSEKHTHTVGLKLPNAWGLYDMHGNVWEWCSDWYDDYPSERVVDPKGPETGNCRVLRGGSWDADARHCRPASRAHVSPGRRSLYVGLRLVVGPPSQL